MQGISLRELSRRTNVPQHTLSDWFQRGWLKDYFVGFSGRSALHSEDAADFILHWRKSKSSKEETMANLFDSTVEDENLRTADDSIPNDEVVANDDKLDSAQAVTIDVDATVIILNDRANRIRQLSFNVAHDIIEIGLELIAAKQEVGHGGWGDWLKKEFAWSQRTANNFMRVAERFGKLENVFQFKPSTLQTMLALPEGTEEEFIEEQAAAGKPIQNQSARQLDQSIKEFKAKATPANHSVVDELNALAANHDSPEDKCPQVQNPDADKCPTRSLVDTSGDNKAAEEPLTFEIKTKSLQEVGNWIAFVHTFEGCIPDKPFNHLMALLSSFFGELAKPITYESRLVRIGERIKNQLKEIDDQTLRLAVKLNIAINELQTEGGI